MAETIEIRASSNPLGALRALGISLDVLRMMEPEKHFEAEVTLWYDPTSGKQQVTGLRVISDGKWREERLGDGEITRIKIAVAPGATFLLLVKDTQTFDDSGVHVVAELMLVAVLSTEKMEHMKGVADRLAQFCYGPHVEATFLDALESAAFAAEWLRDHGAFLNSEDPTLVLDAAASALGGKITLVLLPKAMERFRPLLQLLVRKHPSTLLASMKQLPRKFGPWK